MRRSLGLAPLSIIALLSGASAQGDPRGPGIAPDPRNVPVNEADPRSGKDPRDQADPRESTDPREAEVDPLLEPPGPALFDALYASGQDAQLKQAVGENGWSLLDYIHAQCETWLALRDRPDVESAVAQGQLAAAEAKARKLARFADESLLDSRFQNYVEAVFGWSEEQRVQFRESQELYRQGVARASAARDPAEALGALTPLEQALDRARRLGDTRTQCRTLVAIGNLQIANRDEERARVTMHEVVRLARELRDLDDIWTALSMLYESGVRHQEWELADASLQEQYLIAQDTRDEQTTQHVMRQLISLNAYRDALR